jgi:hypothetical protein
MERTVKPANGARNLAFDPVDTDARASGDLIIIEIVDSVSKEDLASEARKRGQCGFELLQFLGSPVSRSIRLGRSRRERIRYRHICLCSA